MEKRRVVRGICPLRQNLLWVGQLRCVVWLHPEFLVHGLEKTQRALTKCQYWAVHTTVPWPSPRGAYYQSKKKTRKIWLSRIERYEWGRLSKGNKVCSVLMEGKHSPWARNRPAGQESLRARKEGKGLGESGVQEHSSVGSWILKWVPFWFIQTVIQHWFIQLMSPPAPSATK